MFTRKLYAPPNEHRRRTFYCEMVSLTFDRPTPGNDMRIPVCCCCCCCWGSNRKGKPLNLVSKGIHLRKDTSNFIIKKTRETQGHWLDCWVPCFYLYWLSDRNSLGVLSVSSFVQLFIDLKLSPSRLSTVLVSRDPSVHSPDPLFSVSSDTFPRP